MATKLKKMKLTSVDLVRAGANQEASIELFKSEVPVEKDAQSFREITDARKEQEKLWGYNDALTQSVRSIQEDRELDEETRQDLLQETWEQYCAAMAEVLGLAFEENAPEESEEKEPVNVEVEVEKEPEIEEIEEIEEVGKSAFTSESGCDIIEEVQKFNPFHDALGRFVSKNGFKTYSANPKSKAGQMAISRSAQAGHGHTMNVHRESKGENINQNYDWMQGKPYGKPAASAAPATASKPAAGKQTAEKPKTPPAASTKPTTDQDIETAVANINLSSEQKQALQARDSTRQPCSTKKIVDDYAGTRINGQDISKTFDAQKSKGSGTAVDAVVRAQGWDTAPPTITSDRDTFEKLCFANGHVLMRTVHAGQGKTSTEIAVQTMTRSDVPLNASGSTAYGGGMYMVDTRIHLTASAWGVGNRVALGQDESYGYGDTQMMATFRPGAKIATPAQAQAMHNEFQALTHKDRARFNYDYGAYIASKGYDGAKWHKDSDPAAYLTVYNKSALVFFSEVAEA